MVMKKISTGFLLNLDMIATLALAGSLLMLGYFILKKVPFLQKMCLPAPVIGGLLLSIIIWVSRSTHVLNIKMDTTLQLPFMLVFFTCVGFSGSIKQLKSGGRLLLTFLIACWALAVIQSLVGVGLAKVLGINPVLGVMAGPVSLVGGHGNAAAFGPVAEKLGVTGATTVAIASATFGLVVGSLTGGPVGNYLIKKFNIPIPENEPSMDVTVESKSDSAKLPITSNVFLGHLTLIFIFMLGGILVSQWIERINIPNFAIPNYVGAMFLAIVFRNLNDKYHWIELNSQVINILLDIGLGFFLTMAIMTLEIWQLADLALPLLIILFAQFFLLVIIAIFIVFPLLGKNYDGAVMTGGYTGWGMGISATAIVCMSAICEKYGKRSTKAFLIVPLCGAVFVDVVAIPTIIFFITAFA